MVFATIWASPFVDTDILNVFVLITAIMANLTRWIELIHLHDPRSHLAADIVEDILEFSKTIIIDFLAMAFLHGLHAETFKTDDCIFLAQISCELEMKVPALVCLLAIEPCKNFAVFLPVVRAELAA